MERLKGLHGPEGAGWRRDAGLLAPRAMLGATMLYHGAEKLRTPDQTSAHFEKLGIKPPGFWSRATALAEAGAGVDDAGGLAGSAGGTRGARHPGDRDQKGARAQGFRDAQIEVRSVQDVVIGGRPPEAPTSSEWPGTE